MKKKNISLRLRKRKISTFVPATIIAGKQYTDPESDCITWETMCGPACFETLQV